MSEAIDGGRAGARVSLVPGAVQAVTVDGATFRVPFSACRLELGGASERMWFCRSPDRSVTIFSEAPGFADALSRAASRELGGEIERIRGAQRSAARSAALGWLLGLGIVAALLLAGFFAVRALGSGAVLALPTSVDRQLGELAIDNMTLEGEVVHDPVLTAAVDEIVARLGEHAEGEFAFDVRVVDAPVLNAFALPGGPIVVYTGLLRAATSPEQVAGVLAHEMAHVTRRHGMQRVAQSLGVVAAAQLFFGDVSGVAAIALSVLQEGAINSYSREHEHEADMTGVAMLHAAHIDPEGLASFFALLEAREGDTPAAIAWLGTHPQLASRVREVREKARTLGSSQVRPFSFDFAEVKRAAGGDGAAQAEGK